MAKTKEGEQAAWSPEEVAMLLKDLEAKGDALAVLTKKMDSLEPIIERLQIEMQTLGPLDTNLPAEVFQGVRPDMVFTTALQAAITGVIQVYGAPSEGKSWDSLATRCVSLAEAVANKVIARYKLKQKS